MLRLLPLALFLAGCSSYADRVAATCSRLGMGPGTADYHACVFHEEDNDTRQRASYGSMVGAGAYLAKSPTTYVVVP